jgi:hypothetical protein
VAYKKRSSRASNEAQRRFAGFKSIDPTLDLGDGVSVQVFTEMLTHLNQTLDAYNIVLADADTLNRSLVAAEKAISVYAEKVLLAVAVKYGKDSPEYGRVGGVRSSERKRPVRQVALPVAD